MLETFLISEHTHTQRTCIQLLIIMSHTRTYTHLYTCAAVRLQLLSLLATLPSTTSVGGHKNTHLPSTGQP